MDNTVKAENLLKELDAQRDAYIETFAKAHEFLAKAVAATGKRVPASAELPECPDLPRLSGRPTSSGNTGDAHKQSISQSTLQTSSTSRTTGDDTDGEHDESFYVQAPLQPRSYDHEELREHLQKYKWDYYCKRILRTVVDNPVQLQQPWLFPTVPGPVEDRSHFSGYQVFDVGFDGAPIPVDVSEVESVTSKATAIWHSIKDINQQSKRRVAVGRITVFRELSPILFGAVHLTMHHSFDVDEIFKSLVESEYSSAHVHRAFADDPRQQSSFVFSLDYFTVVGDECQPMEWQLADRQESRAQHHIPITRCSCVIALALGGKPIRKVRNPSRRVKDDTSYGYVYDPWAPWQVLNLQCYPDWKSSTDIHDSSRNYVNGPEAFMITLLGEYRDAQSRFEDIYRRITKLITPPLAFMFNASIRDALLFEDQAFTYSRRYFWAFQTLGIINDSIKSMIDAYEDAFPDAVFDGTHKTLWPLLDAHAPRNVFYKKRMAALQRQFAGEIARLRTRIAENNERRAEIRSLRDQLFSGTSVLESRKSVEQTEIAVQQGHNIKLLTLVSIFFLPLTFVTSVFGMTNMPADNDLWTFGVVTATVCVPFFVLVGSLNTTRGLRWWREKTGLGFRKMGGLLGWAVGVGRKGKKWVREGNRKHVYDDEEGASENQGAPVIRSRSAQEGIAMRLRRWSSTGKNAVTTETKETTNGRVDSKGIQEDEESSSAKRKPSQLAEMLKGEKERNRRGTDETSV
ncbi:MAG: hypothetical protein M1822_002578 [Bathelium mastoideum]|nr:MAG: hypothetical protein M1822_002578 [Bathelium mastoideum]